MEKILEDHFMDWDLENFPIHDNYGEGFSFSVNNEKYITKGSYDYQNKEYRNLVLEITTFGVQHYYASINVAVNNIEIDKPSHMIGGYLGGVVIPDKYQSLKIEMNRKVTLEEKNNFPNRWGDYDVDDFTNAFYNEEEIISVFKKMLPNLLKGKWNIDIRAYSNSSCETFLVEY